MPGELRRKARRCWMKLLKLMEEGAAGPQPGSKLSCVTDLVKLAVEKLFRVSAWISAAMRAWTSAAMRAWNCATMGPTFDQSSQWTAISRMAARASIINLSDGPVVVL